MSSFEAQCDCELDSPGVLSHLPIEDRLSRWTEWARYLKRNIETHYRPRIAALEAENERLKCCGNCGERGGDYGDECCRSWLGPVEPYHAYRPADNVAPADHCHFTPSRWQRREG